MDHDRLFKQLLTTFFVEFIELFLPELSAHLQRDSVEFLDKEVFTDLTGGERHEVDLLAKARLKETEAFFLIHVENQATRQPEFGQRMFRYFARLHEKFNLPVYPVALLSYDAPRSSERDHYEVKFPDRRVLSFRYRVIQLNRMNWRDFLRERNPVAAALMTKMNIAPADRPGLKLECLRMIVTLKLDLARSALISEFMQSYLRLSADQAIAYNKQLNALPAKEKRTVVQMVGTLSADGFRKMAAMQLEHRFGRLPQKTRMAIERVPEQWTGELMIALLDFKKISDADNWMEQHKGE